MKQIRLVSPCIDCQYRNNVGLHGCHKPKRAWDLTVKGKSCFKKK